MGLHDVPQGQLAEMEIGEERGQALAEQQLVLEQFCGAHQPGIARTAVEPVQGVFRIAVQALPLAAQTAEVAAGDKVEVQPVIQPGLPGSGRIQDRFLPVGGKGTHTVLTGHSGMATQKMFSDLDKLELGDVFYLQVLDETLAYQVDAIHTVLPYDTSFLGITEGEDYCTLVTCTPFGINTHRLLVRGTRIPYEEAEVITAEKLQVEDTPASTWEQQYIKGILLGIATVAVILVFCIWGSHCQKRRRRRKTRQREQFRPRKRGKYEKA